METTTDAVLNGIITCNQCNAGMTLKQHDTTGRLYFTCSKKDLQGFTSCLTPDLAADKLDKLLVETIMETIMTRKHLNILIAQTDQILAKRLEELQDYPMDQEVLLHSRSDLQAMITSHSYMLQAAGNPQALRELLRKFIDDIRITPGNATVRYKIPLPEDSRLAGQSEQNIPLPTDTLHKQGFTR